MNGTQTQLSSDQHERILRERIIPEHHLEAAISHERPKAIIILAPPGACTGWMSQRLYFALQGDAIRVEVDELADYHPCVAAFRREHPLAWNSLTYPDAEAWAEKLVAAVMAGRKNLILDTTLTDGRWASADFVEALEASGYFVEVLVIVTHYLESELGMDMRFTNSLDREGYGRLLPKAVREESYQNMPERLGAIQHRTDATIRIFNP